jgi:hypothetical protein
MMAPAPGTLIVTLIPTMGPLLTLAQMLDPEQE